MTAATYDFQIEQGATLSKNFVWKTSDGAPIDLTNYAGKLQVRSSVTSDTVLLEMSTQNGRIQLGGTAGTIVLAMANTETSAITWLRGVYSFELTAPDGTVTRLLDGSISVSREIVR
jgi:phage baseplate assembly protein gpV